MSSPRPGGAAASASDVHGWVALPGRTGWTKVSTGPEPEVRFVSSDPPAEPLTIDEIRRRELADRAALDEYVVINAAGLDVVEEHRSAE